MNPAKNYIDIQAVNSGNKSFLEDTDLYSVWERGGEWDDKIDELCEAVTKDLTSARKAIAYYHRQGKKQPTG